MRIVWGILLSLLTLTALAGQKLDYRKLINDVYAHISGYGIEEPERGLIDQSGGSPTYGEITYEGCQQLFELLKLGKKDVFYDLGSGVGKCVVQAILTTPIKKSVGIELSQTRHAGAARAKKELKHRGYLKHRTLKFINGDIATVPTKDATAIFMDSLCFSDEFMDILLKKLSHLKHGLRVATLKEFAPNPYFRHVRTEKIPMSWSQENGSTVYFYELTQPKGGRYKAKKEHRHLKPKV